MVEQQKTVEANKGLYFYMSIHDQDKIIEGKNANKIENAKNLLAMNILTHEQISQAIGLPIEKIEELAKEVSLQEL